MAFNYFTIDSIKKININDIPARFVTYYQGLSNEMKEEIADVRPDLVMAIDGNTATDINQETSAESMEAADDISSSSEVITDEEEIADPVVDIWENMPINLWQKPRVPVDVVVCKIMPDHNRICRIHRVQMQEKNLRLDNGRYGITGYFCPECVDFYLEEQKLEILLTQVEKRKIPTVIQPLEITLQEWREFGVPIEITADDIIYVPDTWVEGQMNCPLHPDEVLLEDNYRKKYRNRQVDFEAHYCKQCKKIIMRNSRAQQLEEDCAEIGIPSIEFKPLRKEKTARRIVQQSITPHYFIVNGTMQEYSFSPDADIDWEVLDEDDTLVVSYSRSCIEEEHETEDCLGLLRVMEKKGALEYYLVYLGYCDQCEQYYIEQEDYELIYAKGRPAVSIIIDEVESEYMVTSGSVFDSEREHLENLEGQFERRISDIEHLPDYVGEYEVISGANNDDAIVQLRAEKEHCRPYYAEIAQLDSYKANPYEYRTDIVFAGKTEVYYLGVNDVYVNGVRKVISNRSNLGRELVNYRNLNIIKDDQKYDVKRRRNFDIVNARLFGYLEQSDEDAVFQKGITDQFLINVLNMRKRQHQLIDIIATIQENQNAIVDRPISENLIVQGCAGSGKTMVLLHRLSILKYNHPDYDFGHVVILTPNDNFNTHISNLAGSLQIGYVSRYSVEAYYRQLLIQYDSSFRVAGEIADEMNVNQTYVDYVYSDEFKELFKDACTRKIQELREYYEEASVLSIWVGRTPLSCEEKTGNELIAPLRDELHSISNVLKIKDENYKNSLDRYNAAKKRYDFLKKKVPEAKITLQQVIKDQCSIAAGKIKTAIQERKNKVSELNQAIEKYNEEYDRVSRAVFMLRKNQKLGTIKGQITRTENKKQKLFNEIDFLSEKLQIDIVSMTETEIHEYMDSLLLYIQNIDDNDRVIRRQRKILDDYIAEWENMPEKLKKAEADLSAAMANQQTPEFSETVEKLETKLKQTTPKTVYNNVYAMASQQADNILKARTGKSFIENIRGVHRYDLYLQLLFSLQYFGTAVGNNTLICIDEGQDLAVNEYQLILDVNRTTPVFNIYGDTNQMLKYGRGISDWVQIKDVITAAKRFDLNENYRNTNQITQFCNKTFNMEVALTGVDGHKVKEIIRNRLENLLSELKLEDERVAILIPRTVKKKSGYVDIERLPYNIREAIGEEIGNGKIAVMYVDEVKGVEFDRVFVVPNGMTKNERYIAYTRALSNLIVVLDETLDPKKEELSSVIESKQPEKAKKQVTASSNVRIGKVQKRKKRGSNKSEKESSQNSKSKKSDKSAKIVSSKATGNNIIASDDDLTHSWDDIVSFSVGLNEEEDTMSIDTLSLSKLKRIIPDFTDEELSFLNNHGIQTIGQFRALTTNQINAFSGNSMNDMLIKWIILQLKNDLEEFIRESKL